MFIIYECLLNRIHRLTDYVPTNESVDKFMIDFGIRCNITTTLRNVISFKWTLEFMNIFI